MKNYVPYHFEIKGDHHYKQWIRRVKDALRKAEDEIEKNHEQGVFDEGDPNNPKYNDGFNYKTKKYISLFGMNQDDLIHKQYK